MNKTNIQQLLDTNKSLKLIAEELNTSQTNLRYWIKKYELVRNKYTHCVFCNTKSSTKFCSSKCKGNFYYYQNKEERNLQSKINSKDKRKSFKILAIEYGGGKCKHCNYKNNYSVLSFHHTDTEQKDFNLRGIKSSKLTSKHIEELDKCILLCHNCHYKVHSLWNDLKPKGKQAIKGAKVRRQLIEYKGRML